MIWTYCHKITNYEQVTPGTTGLQVGPNPRFLSHRDSDFEDNVAEWNPVIAENSAIYYIWKHDHDPYKGGCQYRRHLPLAEGLSDGFRVRTCIPIMLSPSVRIQYSAFHSPLDIERVTEVIRDLHPDYSEDWEKVLDGRLLFYSNGFAMMSEDYDAYCEWLFSIFDEYRRRQGWETPDDVRKQVEAEINEGKRNRVRGLAYQTQVLAFLSERLFTLYVTHNFKQSEIWTDRYHLMEAIGF